MFQKRIPLISNLSTTRFGINRHVVLRKGHTPCIHTSRLKKSSIPSRDGETAIIVSISRRPTQDLYSIARSLQLNSDLRTCESQSENRCTGLKSHDVEPFP